MNHKIDPRQACRIVLLVVMLLTTLPAVPALAIPEPEATATLIGTGGSVNVTERIFAGFVDYSVDVLDTSSVAAFAVSNGGGAYPESYTSRADWSSQVLDSAAWDGGVNISGSSSSVSFNTASVGAYSTYFGSDPLVSVYWNDTSSGSEIDESSDEAFEFLFYPEVASEFVALTAAGGLIDSSLAALDPIVPEPSTLALSVIGLLSLVFVGWRRRRR